MAYYIPTVWKIEGSRPRLPHLIAPMLSLICVEQGAAFQSSFFKQNIYSNWHFFSKCFSPESVTGEGIFCFNILRKSFPSIREGHVGMPLVRKLLQPESSHISPYYTFVYNIEKREKLFYNKVCFLCRAGLEPMQPNQLLWAPRLCGPRAVVVGLHSR